MSDMTYAVHTATCTYLLDDEGVCLWTLSPGGQAATDSDRCVGAQFVACLDLTAPGGLVGELRVGAAALFARREHGRFVLLRTTSIDRVDHRPSTYEEAHSYRDVLNSQDATAVLGPEESVALIEREETHAPPPAQVPAMRAPPMRAPHARPMPLPPAPPAPPADSPPAIATHPLPDPWSSPPQIIGASALAAQRWAAEASQRAARTRSQGGMPAPPPPRTAIAYEPVVEDEFEALDAEDLVSISVTEVTLTMPLYRPPAAHHAMPLPPPAAPPRRPGSMPPPPPDDLSGPPTPRGPPPARHGVVGPGRRLR